MRPPRDDVWLDQVGAGDHELGQAKELDRRQVQAAFEEAVRSLAPTDRNLLRLHYLDGLSLEEVAAVQGVHRATAARWLARARTSLFDGTRAALARDMGVERIEYNSLMRFVLSRFVDSIALAFTE